MATGASASMGTEDLRGMLALLDSRFAQRTVQAGEGVVSYRSCGASGPTVVLLHGIGSGSASWLRCALALESDARVVAWDAPGYGQSSRLAEAEPLAADYARRLQAFLQSLQIERCVLVGHSLGAMMACAHAASAGPGAVSRLVLLSPAQGYGGAALRARGQEVARQRLQALDTLGVEGIAARGPERMLSAGASAEARAWVRWNMQRLDPAGYRQAVAMLCGDDVTRHAPTGLDVEVHCGDADVVTPVAQCQALAERFAAPFATIEGAGHACYVEQPEQVAHLIRRALPQSSRAPRND